MVELVKYLVTSLVSHPEDVAISVVEENEKTIVITVSVNADDMGKIIGRGGKVASSIRTIVKSASIKENKRYIVKIAENTAEYCRKGDVIGVKGRLQSSTYEDIETGNTRKRMDVVAEKVTFLSSKSRDSQERE